ncbi:MAG: fimbrillin family protein [Bacteroidales bacterium]|nr:fimbrillin family protein [Bacteroidales bacterium]
MKRFSLLLLGALAIFMAGCSKHNPQQPDPDAWVTDLSLPVPIQFGSPSIIETKAGFESLSDLENTTFAVFGLPKADPTGTALLLNEPATLESGYLALSKGTKYYPRESDENYSFYAYAPQAASGGTSPTIQIGTQDYVWAQTVAEPVNDAEGNEVDGYNAKYMRTIRQMGVAMTHSPNFAFKHVTSGLKIMAVANITGQDTSSDTDFKDIKITDVLLTNMYRAGTLDVTTGEVSGLTNKGGQYLLKDGNVSPTKAGVLLGEAYPYLNNSEEPITLTVDVESPVGKYTVSINIKEMQPGVRYVYKVMFNKPDDVRIAVSGVGWDEEQEISFDDNGQPLEN